MRSLVFRPGSSLLIVSGLLLLVWAFLLVAMPARSTDALVTASPRTQIITDTRWIELIRSSGPGPQLHRSASALPTLNLHLTDNLIAGRASSSALITIDVWRDNAPLIRAIATPYPDDVNYFYTVLLGQYPLKPGDVISLTQSGASFTMTIPSLTVQVDAPTARVSGTAPVSRSVTTYLYSNVTGSGPYTQTVEIDASGTFTADYSAMLDVRPRDSGYVAYSEAPGRTTYVRIVTPFLRAQAGGAEISGMAAPLSWVYLTVADAAGKPYGDWGAYSAADGSFGDDYYGYWGFHLKPGDLITATGAGQTFTMTVLTLTAQIDLNSSLIEGDAPANQPLELLRFDGPLCCSTNAFWRESPAEQTTITTTVAGHYNTTMALARPNYGVVIATGPDGNQTYARFAVPYLAVRMGGYSYTRPNLLSGQIGEVAVPITIAIQGPSGYLKDTRSTTSAANDYFYDSGSDGVTLDSGDVITVTTAQGMQVALQLPLLTGEIDPVTDIISGTAPPDTRLTLNIYSYGSTLIAPPTPAPTPTPYLIAGGGGGGGGGTTLPYTVIMTTTAQGQYLVNLHGVIDLNNSSSGEVSLTTIEGHAVTRILTLSRQEGCDYRPYWIGVGGNRVDFWATTSGCKSADYGIVRLRDASGNLKVQQALPVWGYSYQAVVFYANGYPVIIAPGDRVEVEWSTTTAGPTPVSIVTVPPFPTYTPYAPHAATDNHFVTIDVLTLTVQLDPAANVLSGQAPASSTVALMLNRGYNTFFSDNITVGAQGSYTLTLPAGVALAAGDAAQVSYKSIELPTFSATGVLPVIRTALYRPLVSGLLPPFTVYTAALQTAPSETQSYGGITASDGSFSFGSALIEPGDLITVTTAQHTLHLTVPVLTAHVKRATATIFGQAPPFAHLQVTPYSYDYGHSQTVTATVSGTYSVTFPDLAPMNTTDYGQLTYYDANGNQVDLPFATVHWDVVVNDRCLTGIVDMTGTPLTLTLHSNSGALKSAYFFTPPFPYYTACFTEAVQSGDRISLQSPAATEVFTVPLLTARHNYARQAVEGSAPSNEALFAEFTSLSSSPRRVFADGSSQYGVDTSDLHLPLLSRGRVVVWDAGGNSTSIYFTVTGYPVFLPLIRQ